METIESNTMSEDLLLLVLESIAEFSSKRWCWRWDGEGQATGWRRVCSEKSTTFQHAPRHLSKAKATCKWWYKVADSPRIWLRLGLPCCSRANMASLMSVTCKLDKAVVLEKGDDDSYYREAWKHSTLVFEGLTRHAGSSTVVDAMCGTGMGHVSNRDVSMITGLNNDLVVRCAYAVVEGASTKLKVMTMNTHTATHTPLISLIACAL